MDKIWISVTIFFNIIDLSIKKSYNVNENKEKKENGMTKYDVIDTFFEMLNQKKESGECSDDLYVKYYKKFLNELFVSNDNYNVEKILDVLQYVSEKYDENLDKTKFLRDFILGLKDKKQVKKYLNDIEDIIESTNNKLRSVKISLPVNLAEKYGVKLTKNEIEKIKSKYSIVCSNDNSKKLTNKQLDAYKTLINEMVKSYKFSLSELLKVAKEKSTTTFNELGVKYEEMLINACPELSEYIDSKINQEKNILLAKKKEVQQETLQLKQEVSCYKSIINEATEKFNIKKTNANTSTNSLNSENGLCGGGGCL